SGQKVNKMLGATPVIDVVSPGKSALTPISTPRSALNASVLDGKRAPLRAFTAPSPARRVHIATTRADTYDNGLKSPVLQITVTSPSNENQDASAHTSKTTNAGRGIRRKKVPAALPLNQASRTEALPLSPFRYATLKAVKAPSLSPVAPFSPFSPITVKKVEESKVEKLQNLEKLAQYSAVGIPQEMIYPSFGQVEEKTEQITCFLDLYRMGTMGQSDRRGHRAPHQAAGRANSRSSTGSMKRRSRSAGDFYSVTDALALESPSFGARMNSQLHAASVLSPVGTNSAFLAPPEPVLSAGRASFTSALFSPSIYSQFSARSAEFPLSPELRMATFRTRFGVRPLEFALPVTPLPLPMGPLPSPPMSPAPPAEVRSPRVPYWVKSSYRPRDSTHALELVNMRYDPEGKRRSAKRKTVLPTPTTQRFERRMGWGGEWNQGGMANWVDSLKQL
ncbi:uncharacterized protein B0H18DRAFT_960196, partial [Fomitopsis serialis]|uniref:uncharacterized protein n=1 Tax=Fomitopsis serialis TaxID=139415 RepID=UPI002008B1A8